MTMYRKSASENHLQAVRSAPFGEHYREEDLETLLEQNPTVLAEGEPLLIISRQPNTQESGTPDLLALDADGNVVIVELKRGRSPRDVIAQALEYAAWTSRLDQAAIKALAVDYLARSGEPSSFAKAWRDAFGQIHEEDEEALPILDPEVALNGRQRIILVLEGRDARIRKVVDYLRRHGIEINIVEYLYYRTDSGEEFLDIEAVHTPQESAQLQPSEASLLTEWPPEAREAYRAYRDTLLTANAQITVELRKTGISFYKQTRGGRVFLGTVAPSQGRMRLWFRRDSLQNHLDTGELEKTLAATMPANMVYRETGPDHRRIDFDMRAEDGRIVANLVLNHIAKELD